MCYNLDEIKEEDHQEEEEADEWLETGPSEFESDKFPGNQMGENHETQFDKSHHSNDQFYDCFGV